MKDSSSQKIRVFLLDDHPAVREGLSILLSRFEMVICGEADNCREAIQVLPTASPDLVLIDLSLGDENGLDLVRHLQSTGMKSLIYSMHDDVWHIQSALTAGAQGYVTKGEMTGILKDAIQTILTGQTYLSPAAVDSLQEQSLSSDDLGILQRLSTREYEIFQLVGEGYSTVEIADELVIAVSTVETNLARMIEKLELTGTKEMRRYAIQHLRTTNPKL